MRRQKLIGLVLLAVTPLGAAYDSALAPYPFLRQEPYDAAVEAVLTAVEANAAKTPGFSATVSWNSNGHRILDESRDAFGPFSSKSVPNWHSPKNTDTWQAVAYTIAGLGPDFRIEKPANGSAPDWWHKAGEHIYSRRYSDDWHAHARLHYDALEADILGYCEGLGLLLWAFQPGEYLRRADHLELGTDTEVLGKTCKTLIATPAWIKTPYVLENRTHYPFNHSTILSWAVHRPVVTYFIEARTGAIIAAEFVYYDCFRSSPRDWKTVAKPSGLSVFCAAHSLAQTTQGTWYPAHIEADVVQKDGVARRTTLDIVLGVTPEALPVLELTAQKRLYDLWPLYRPQVYQAFMQQGEVNHATRVGLACGLAYDGQVADAALAIGDALACLEEDQLLAGTTWGGIDWELGFALYENLWRYSDPELVPFLNSVPRTKAWAIVLRKAVELYGRYRGKDAARAITLAEEYKLFNAEACEPDYQRRVRIHYLHELRDRAEKAPTEELRNRLEALAQDVEAALNAHK